VVFNERASIGRYWGIPIVGHLVRFFCLIPHIIALWVLGFLACLALLVTWIPVLLLGRMPAWGYLLLGGFIRWFVRVSAWGYLMAGAYPPFSLSNEVGQDVIVTIEEGALINRLWGIPLVGYMVRALILIPHLIVLWLLGIFSALTLLFAWVPVLLLGRQAEFVYLLVGGYLRWSTRVTAYFLLLTDRYPPFSLNA
jgi:hypothetical protein